MAVEALAQGVPVVSTDCSFLLHDIITAPEAGRSWHRASLARWRRRWRRSAPRRRAPEKLQALVAPFEPAACARAYLDWFDDLVPHG